MMTDEDLREQRRARKRGKEAGQGSEVQELLSGRVEELEGVQVWVCGWLRR